MENLTMMHAVNDILEQAYYMHELCLKYATIYGWLRSHNFLYEVIMCTICIYIPLITRNVTGHTNQSHIFKFSLKWVNKNILAICSYWSCVRFVSKQLRSGLARITIYCQLLVSFMFCWQKLVVSWIGRRFSSFSPVEIVLILCFNGEN